MFYSNIASLWYCDIGLMNIDLYLNKMSTLDSHIYFSLALTSVWADFASLSWMPDSFSALIVCRSRHFRVYNANETLLLLKTGEDLLFVYHTTPPDCFNSSILRHCDSLKFKLAALIFSQVTYLPIQMFESLCSELHILLYAILLCLYEQIAFFYCGKQFMYCTYFYMVIFLYSHVD